MRTSPSPTETSTSTVPNLAPIASMREAAQTTALVSRTLHRERVHAAALCNAWHTKNQKGIALV